MNFALLGDDPAVVPLVAAIAAHPGHQLTRASLVGATTLSKLLQIAPGLSIDDGWEGWVSNPTVDTVIVVGDDDAVLDAARKLAAAGRSLMILPIAGQGLAFVYELTLIRDDARIALCPAFIQRFEPAVVALKALIEAGELGRLMHLQFERTQRSADSTESPQLVSQSEIDEVLLHDVDLLRSLAGNYSRVTALHSGTVSDRMSMAQVTLAGEGMAEASWSLKATQPGPCWKLVAVGERRTVVLTREDPSASIQLDADDVTQQPPTAERDPIDRLLETCETLQSGEPGSPDWTDLTQAFELVDAARRSVRRRRTIDVYFETASERSVFKTQMTAVGCGLLMLTFVAVLIVLIIGTLLQPNETVMLVLRGLVFLPLVLFLLLQVLLVVTRASTGENSSSEKNHSDE
jgi:UDP-N-acetylglucosamine 3-dehydrogenase